MRNGLRERELRCGLLRGNAEDDGYTFFEIEEKTGPSGSPASYTPKSYTGFHFDHRDEKKPSPVMAPRWRMFTTNGMSGRLKLSIKLVAVGINIPQPS